MRIYRSLDGRYHVASAQMKRAGTVSDRSLRGALGKMANIIEREDVANIEPEKTAPPVDCPKCGGAGWLWWRELDEYDGPALKGGFDDTRYSCDHECHRS